MNHVTDNWTRKPVIKPSDLVPQPNGLRCDDCSGALIDRCLRCGAPICCPECCSRGDKA